MQNKVFSVKNIAKSFGSEKERNYIEVIRDISMDIDEKEFIVILGNSGCGKSTFLKILGGIDSATGGSMELYGKDIGRQIPRDALKHFGFVFQSNNLLPWRTAEGNLRFNLNTMKLKGPEWEKRIDEMLDIVGLLDYKKVYTVTTTLYSTPFSASNSISLEKALALERDIPESFSSNDSHKIHFVPDSS